MEKPESYTGESVLISDDYSLNMTFQHFIQHLKEVFTLLKADSAGNSDSAEGADEQCFFRRRRAVPSDGSRTAQQQEVHGPADR